MKIFSFIMAIVVQRFFVYKDKLFTHYFLKDSICIAVSDGVANVSIIVFYKR